MFDRGVCARHYARGLVVVNPSDAKISYDLGKPMYLVTPVGGGVVPDDGHIPPDWRLDSMVVTSVTLGPQEAAVLLEPPPGH